MVTLTVIVADGRLTLLLAPGYWLLALGTGGTLAPKTQQPRAKNRGRSRDATLYNRAQCPGAPSSASKFMRGFSPRRRFSVAVARPSELHPTLKSAPSASAIRER